MVSIPWFCSGFKHPFGGAGFRWPIHCRINSIGMESKQKNIIGEWSHDYLIAIQLITVSTTTGYSQLWMIFNCQKKSLLAGSIETINFTFAPIQNPHNPTWRMKPEKISDCNPGRFVHQWDFLQAWSSPRLCCSLALFKMAPNLQFQTMYCICDDIVLSKTMNSKTTWSLNLKGFYMI